MKEEFKVMPHTNLPDKEMVEFWRNGKFIAGIYATGDGLRVVSKYMVSALPEGTLPATVHIELAFPTD